MTTPKAGSSFSKAVVAGSGPTAFVKTTLFAQVVIVAVMVFVASASPSAATPPAAQRARPSPSPRAAEAIPTFSVIACGARPKYANSLAMLLFSIAAHAPDTRVVVLADDFNLAHRKCSDHLGHILPNLEYRKISEVTKLLVHDPAHKAARTKITQSGFLCSDYKLELPLIFPELDFIVNLDTDMIFLQNPHTLWRDAKAALAPPAPGGVEPAIACAAESADPKGHGYNIHWKGRPPSDFFGSTGLNTGTVAMDLGAMRRGNITLAAMIATLKGRVGMGEQDLVNAYGGAFPERVRVLPCKWNHRVADGCVHTTNFAVGGLLHGNREQFVRPHKAAGWPVGDMAFSLMVDKHLGAGQYTKDAILWERFLFRTAHAWIKSQMESACQRPAS